MIDINCETDLKKVISEYEEKINVSKKFVDDNINKVNIIVLQVLFRGINEIEDGLKMYKDFLKDLEEI